MKTIINSNVERIIEDEMLEKYKALGYKEISSSKANDNAPENKPLSKMKVDELKALATELGIENTDYAVCNLFLIIVAKLSGL